MSVPFIPTKNATAGVTTAPTTANLTTAGQMAINAYTGAMYMRKEDSTISDIVGDRLSGFRNRIINGNMAIDQRNAGASISTASGTSGYSLDRWFYENSQTSKFTMQQNAGAISAPVGFKNYLGCTSLSAYSVLSGDYFHIGQRIEGYNVTDLGWGASGASPVTLSFWVRSSLTGTFGGAVRNALGTRSYPFVFSISSANTWEQKTITIPGDTSGTWATDNSAGLQITFGLGTGSTYSGTAGSWASSNYISATGATSVVGTNAATFYITGVQLEKGLIATPFEVRSYGTELALCQRYCLALAPNSFQGIGTLRTGGASIYGVIPLPVPLRAAPTAPSNANTFYCGDSNTTGSIVISGISSNSIYVTSTLLTSIGSVGNCVLFDGVLQTVYSSEL